jgi:ubiquinone/menaquinone biosynthesis C-methylase UbiE
VRRGRFQGLFNVVRFNWDMYLKAALVLAVVFLVPWPGQLGFWARLGAAGAAYFLTASLVASHIIYDLSDLYRWHWFQSRFYLPERIVNIHSGFDETTEQLKAMYPDSQITALDFYDPSTMTEPSISRARSAYPDHHSRPVSYNALGLADDSEELVTCLLAAHELREHPLRVEFFREVQRVVRTDGRMVVLEHLRDVPNFLAFGPGFVHFFSHKDWMRALEEAGFWIEEEFRVTPFVCGFVCRKAR